MATIHRIAPGSLNDNYVVSLDGKERILRVAFGGTEISEVACFVPDDDDHPDDIDDDAARPDYCEGSTTIRHPVLR